MQALSRIWFIVLIGIAVSVTSRDSFAQEHKKENRGSISGRVTLEGKPVPRVTVMLTSSDRFSRGTQSEPPVRSTTDEDGRYRLTGLLPGSYAIMPNTPAFVVVEERVGQGGQPVSILEGEEVEDINFTLKPGGVITGRIADADGKPIIGGRVTLMQVDERGRLYESSYSNWFKYLTDDRGVYRVYGLQPGRYKVCFGDVPDGRTIRVGNAGPSYARTFHPDVAEEGKSPIVEVTAGIEATGIDVTVGRTVKTYIATGRIVDAETGAPLSNIQYGYGVVLPNAKSMGAIGWTNNKTNSTGEFRIEGLPSGRFAAFAVNREESESYSDPSIFEVADGDVSGLEIKIHRGSSISGVAIIEGNDDPELLAKLSKVEIRSSVVSESVSGPRFAPTRLGVNGSFKIVGLQPGKVRIYLGMDPSNQGFSLLRVERDGVEQREIVVGPGEQVSGIRLVIGYGTGIIRGQVKFQGGERSPDLHLFVNLRRVGGTTSQPHMVEVDARGRFRVEGLPAGEYEAILVGNWAQPGGSRPAPVTQNVIVVNGSEAEVTLVLNLRPTGKDGEK